MRNKTLGILMAAICSTVFLLPTNVFARDTTHSLCNMELEPADCKEWSCVGEVTSVTPIKGSGSDKIVVDVLLNASQSRQCYLIQKRGFSQGDHIAVNTTSVKFEGDELTVVTIKKAE